MAAGLRVLLVNYLVECRSKGLVLVLVLAGDLVLAQKSSLIRDLVVETVRSAVVLHPPSAQGLRCHENERPPTKVFL